MKLNKFEEIGDIRKEINKIGFTVLTQKLSFGTYATYKHKESGECMTGNVFSAETLKKWTPLIQWIKDNFEDVYNCGKENRITGLTVSLKKPINKEENNEPIELPHP